MLDIMRGDKYKKQKAQMFSLDFFIAFILVLMLLLTYIQFKQLLNHRQPEDYSFVAELMISKYLLSDGRVDYAALDTFHRAFHDSYNKILRETTLYEEGADLYISLVVYNSSKSIVKNLTIGEALSPEEDNEMICIDRYALDEDDNIVQIKIGVYK